ncbi:MAG TPA: hypothetical protein VIN59_06985 [Alphaproteobacteria bacterium]
MLRLIILLLLLPFSAYAQGTHLWQDYTNVRYAYSICYPADLLIPQGEADNSDGQAFIAKDGAKLIVYASYNAAEKTLGDALNDVSGDLSYRRLANDWFAASGTQDGKIFYTKTMFNDGQFTSFKLTYDQAQADVYNPLIKKLLGCFEKK